MSRKISSWQRRSFRKRIDHQLKDIALNYDPEIAEEISEMLEQEIVSAEDEILFFGSDGEKDEQQIL